MRAHHMDTLQVITHPPVTRELHADDINWELQPVPETPPAHPDELLVDALIDSESYRAVNSAAFHHAHRLYVELEQLRTIHARLIEDYRALRQSTGASS